ncbi:DMT family transporter [Sneathiella glossodoripedis]|uniref:DMT family transporter n=1 Tax=Sneathiella glossodoripedis TaxID=418853 RepID=UPI00046F8A32|nr:DMT family transporter [Sneathiella glossodoripedis]
MTVSPSSPASTILLTSLAMIAFAANSVLCRQALGDGHIDAASFTTLRMCAGAVTLYFILKMRGDALAIKKANWKSAAALFVYMAFFSFAYISLGAGAGALLLFGAVQITMFAAAIKAREHFSALSWAGLFAAIGGLVYLVSPGVSSPDALGATLMVIAGIAWGLYSLQGKGNTNPLQATAQNFLIGIPLVLVTSLLFSSELDFTTSGIYLALASGALASGCGYVIWYAVLPHLTSGRAATVQLTVPAIAALGGAVFLSEPFTMRLIIASIVTLGGVAIVLSQRARST